jgi:uncharacterized membrane protein
MGTKYMTPLMMQVVGAYVYSAIAPVAFLFMKATNITSDWNWRGVLWTSGACILATIASLSFNTAVQRTHVHLVVGFTSVYPVLSFLLCWIFLGEPVTTVKLLGIAAIVIGTVLLSL